jgi:hypothetical protein
MLLLSKILLRSFISAHFIIDERIEYKLITHIIQFNRESVIGE